MSDESGLGRLPVWGPEVDLAKPSCASAVVVRRFGDGMVLVDLESNRVYELTATAARLWELLAIEPDIERAREQLRQEFEVDVGRLSSETEAFIGVLRAEGLFG